MPTDTAMETLSAYKLKRKQNPSADQATLFKYVLWDRFSGKMISDSEIDAMAKNARTLGELALEILKREKPAMADGRLEASARDAIKHYFVINYPDGI